MSAAREERQDLCEELRTIESDLVKQLIRLYRRGTDFAAFWEAAERVYLFSQLRKNICEESKA